MRFGVLGAVRAYAADGSPIPLGDRQRALLAALLARSGRIVPADLLAELIWGEAPPADPAAALHSQVSRLRRALPDARIETEPPGYVLRVDTDEVDAGRFDRLVEAAAGAGADEAAGLLEEALALWRGPAYAGLADTEIARLEAIRLGEARLHATEQWHRALLDTGQAARSLPRFATATHATTIIQARSSTRSRTDPILQNPERPQPCSRPDIDTHTTRIALEDELKAESYLRVQASAVERRVG